MSMLGGRSGEASLRSLVGALGAASLAAALGCGSRTSMLDPNVYAADGGGAAAGGGSSGGKPATGGAASGGKAGFDPSAANAPCAMYCSRLASLCVSDVDGQDCNADCLEEVNEHGETCQALGIATLTCFTPFFEPNSGTCGEAIGRATLKCGATAEKFDQCQDFDDEPAPTLDPASCPSMGSVSPQSCTTTFSCGSGTYVTRCALTSDGMLRLSCSCERPDGSTTYRVVTDSSSGACAQMASYCE